MGLDWLASATYTRVLMSMLKLANEVRLRRYILTSIKLCWPIGGARRSDFLALKWHYGLRVSSTAWSLFSPLPRRRLVKALALGQK